MPNHVLNEVTLHGVPIEKSAKVVGTEGSPVDFEALVPMPVNFWPGSVSSKHEEYFPGTHLGAARRMWGTKWNAYGEPEVFELDGSTVLRFQTAWSPPRGWICALFNTFKCEITAIAKDEGSEHATIDRYIWDDKRNMGGPSWSTERATQDVTDRMEAMFFG
jgi:hypothetical protein